MPIYKFPIAHWQDAAGNFHVSTIAGTAVTAVDHELNRAIELAKKYLVWKSKSGDSIESPDFKEPKVVSMTFPLRGQDIARREQFPSETVTQVRFQLIWGKRADGSISCVIPQHELSFHCSNPSMLKILAEEAVRNQFSGKSLKQLIRAMTLGNLQLDSINVRLNQAPRNDLGAIPHETLKENAIPLGVRQTQKQFSQPLQREAEVKKVAELLKDRQRNLLLVGNSGIGKTTILAEAAKVAQRKLMEEEKSRSNIDPDDVLDRPSSLTQQTLDRQPLFWLTSAPRLIAGMQYLGQWQSRCEAIIEELSELTGVLCVENLLDLVLTGGGSPDSSLAAFFQNFMVNQEMVLVGEATPRELETIRRLMPGWEGLFETVRIQPMDDAAAFEVLNTISVPYCRNHQWEIEPSAMNLVLGLHQRFLPYDSFPGQSVAFWKSLLNTMLKSTRRTAIESTVNEESQRQSPASENRSPLIIGPDDVIQHFIQKTGLPEWLIRDEWLLEADQVRKYMKDQIIGQAAACESIVQLILLVKAAMNDPQRPLGVMLFCGPTGVGKTEMALTLSRYLFGGGEKPDDRFIRLDMSEYQGLGAAQRLLIDASGLPSPWLNRIRQQPFSVILLDEIEKASAEVFDLLMNVFDEGLMIDRLGRETSFRSSIIIMTSNLGAQAAPNIGFGEPARDPYITEVWQFFRPEFFNRLDGVVRFNHLTNADVRAIAEKEIIQLSRREGLNRQQVRLHCTPALLNLIVDEGYDHRYGARPLQRAIEARLTAPIARYLAAHPGLFNQTLTLDWVDGKVRIYT